MARDVRIVFFFGGGGGVTRVFFQRAARGFFWAAVCKFLMLGARDPCVDQNKRHTQLVVEFAFYVVPLGRPIKEGVRR